MLSSSSKKLSAVSTATAPDLAASTIKSRASTFSPGSAANKKPGSTNRESEVIPKISLSKALRSGIFSHS